MSEPTVEVVDDPRESRVKVTSLDGRRTHFEGLKDDAKDFVVRNFPRPHIEPGRNESFPDVVIAHDGGKSFYDGKSWNDYKEGE